MIAPNHCTARPMKPRFLSRTIYLFFAFIISGTRIIARMPPMRKTRIRVIFKFLHLICFRRSVLFFLNTDACSLSASDRSARDSACSVFLSIAAILSCICTFTSSTFPIRDCALSTLLRSSYFLHIDESMGLDFFVKELVVADFAWSPNCSEYWPYSSTSIWIATREGYCKPVMTERHKPSVSAPYTTWCTSDCTTLKPPRTPGSCDFPGGSLPTTMPTASA
mmetsp:Transcript_37013/g.110846  ORF Transcript_37013/g.110846 Transcript_37013/m.110846 type:complete len:222 (+) Transcript_37013:126-791(+)